MARTRKINWIQIVAHADSTASRVQKIGFFEELASYLEHLGLEVLDLTEVFANGGVGVHQAYWRYDGHFSPNGNRIVADALTRRWGK